MINSVLQHSAMLAVVAMVWTSTAVAGETAAVRHGDTARAWLTNQQTLTGRLDARTDAHRLWLRFGGGSTVVLRSIRWQRIVAVEHGGRRFATPSFKDLVPIGDRASDPVQSNKSVSAVDDSAIELSDSALAHRALGFRRKLAAVRFEAHLANWDADITADGLMVHILTEDQHGRCLPVRGVLSVKLVSTHRTAFHEAPRSRGQVVQALGNWTVRVDRQQFVSSGATLRLPFQASHPELDTDWASHGLVQLRLVVPGHGVFERSIDGVRIRPFAPLRDHLERHQGRRFLVSENTGR